MNFKKEYHNEYTSSEEEILNCDNKLIDKLKRKHQKQLDILKRRNKELEYENEIKSAIIRQYQNKCKKIKTLTVAALDREEYLLEEGNSKLETNCIDDCKVESDPEDKAQHNKVKYWCE